ncbi:MAG: glycosyltransferase family protein [Candidatus Peribacteraceae bacterium]|jgi:spore coat polysaccharide biosynthesis protein SpsF (cytidylyltransferase family)|nr:glycosyltransferase family protein [Candidatus Peribacteraceae bacterium]
MKTIAIIQARMSSRRLPGKILADVAGAPLLTHVVRRAKAAGVFDAVIVATSTEKTDDPVQAFCKAQDVPCFRGSLDDVLDRYYQTAKSSGADHIVRLTADCPLLDPVVIRMVIDALDEHYDYVSNALHRTYPKGLDTEAFSLQTLARVWEQARLPSEREHVTPFIYKNPTLFRVKEITQQTDRSTLRWTVDEQRDLDFVRAVYKELGDGVFSQEEILSLLKTHPEIQKLNEGIDPNEGYRQSLEKDAAFLPLAQS